MFSRRSIATCHSGPGPDASTPTAASSRSHHTQSCGERMTEQDMTSTLIDQQLPPPYTRLSLPSNKPPRFLSRPIAIPRTGPGSNDPFIRAYPSTTDAGIDEAEWIHFIDGLNAACRTSSAVKVVGQVGAGLAMVPNLLQGHIPNVYVKLASVGIGHAATIGNHMYTKRTCDKYLSAANDRLFNPKDLTCRIFTTQALRVLLGLQADGAPTGRLGNLLESVGPMAMSLGMKKVDHAVHLVAKRTEGAPRETIERYKATTTSLADHALAMMGDRIQPIRPTTLAPPNFPTAWHEHIFALTGSQSSSSILSAPQKTREEIKSGRKILKEQKRRTEGKKPKKMGKREESLALRSHWDLERIVWVVVISRESDTAIQGAEQYDTTEAVQISDQEVQAELARERVWADEVARQAEEDERRGSQGGENTSGSESGDEARSSGAPIEGEGSLLPGFPEKAPVSSGGDSMAEKKGGKKWWQALSGKGK